MNVRPPILAGTWYPQQQDRLRADVRRFLSDDAPPALPAGRPVIALAPHAGYQYSGPVAGKLYRALSGRSFAAVFILAPCHRTPLRLPALSSLDAFGTPLGAVPLATDIVRELAATGAYEINDRAHAFEHAVEIQLPLLQCALPEGTPIVPILFARLDRDRRRAAARALDPWRDDRHLFLVSSDLTHYGDAYGYVPFTTEIAERLARLDTGAIQKFLALDAAGLVAYEEATGITMCGLEAAAVALDAPPPPAHRSVLLSYERSCDLTGEQSLSVSYAAALICAGAAENRAAPAREQSLTDRERTFLASLARAAVDAAVCGGPAVEPEALATAADLPLAPRLDQERGAFVTLTLDGRLRGCIGTLEASKSLVQTVVDSARSAACHDPRFAAVRPEECARLQIEVSVLTPLSPVGDPQEIIIGEHGILLTKGRRQAVFLPQVPVEQGWDLEATLSQLALKAGLGADDWRRDCSFQVFAAEICHE